MPHFNVQERNEMTRDIAARWKPYLDSVGIDSRGWSDWEIYSLAAIVWDNEIVFEARVSAGAPTQAARKEACGLIAPIAEYPATLPDPLPIVQSLPEKHKAAIRKAVMEARGRLVLATR